MTICPAEEEETTAIPSHHHHPRREDLQVDEIRGISRPSSTIVHLHHHVDRMMIHNCPKWIDETLPLIGPGDQGIDLLLLLVIRESTRKNGSRDPLLRHVAMEVAETTEMVIGSNHLSMIPMMMGCPLPSTHSSKEPSEHLSNLDLFPGKEITIVATMVATTVAPVKEVI